MYVWEKMQHDGFETEQALKIARVDQELGEDCWWKSGDMTLPASEEM